MFTLQPLPFLTEGLEPHISALTLEFHYGAHHKTYVDNLNKMVAGTDLENLSLEEIIKKTANSPEQKSIFNNAAQVYNHDFFWASLKPTAVVSQPSADLLAAINTSFGSLDNLLAEFKTAALGQFGSGWVWLVKSEGELKLMKTSNADTPMMGSDLPLLALDVWEHAYYLDYQNRRGDFVSAILTNLLNWDFASKNFQS